MLGSENEQPLAIIDSLIKIGDFEQAIERVDQEQQNLDPGSAMGRIPDQKIERIALR